VHARARTLTDNLPQWQATLAAARAALGRGRALLEQVSEGDNALRSRAGLLQATLDEDERDRHLAATFETIREGQTRVDVARGKFQSRSAFPRLIQALAGYGLPCPATDPVLAIRRIQGRPPAVRAGLVTLLDVACATGRGPPRRAPAAARATRGAGNCGRR